MQHVNLLQLRLKDQNFEVKTFVSRTRPLPPSLIFPSFSTASPPSTKRVPGTGGYHNSSSPVFFGTEQYDFRLCYKEATAVQSLVPITTSCAPISLSHSTIFPRLTPHALHLPPALIFEDRLIYCNPHQPRRPSALCVEAPATD